MRYFIEIAYCGKNYSGWQIQPKQISVQQVLEECLSVFLRIPTKITGAGRTDTGVHALQTFAHFNLEQKLIPEEFLFRINSFLPDDIVIKKLYSVTDRAHARFDALERTYEYMISLGKNPFLRDYSWQIYKFPDIDKMNQAAQLLLSHKDFECFSRTKSDVKTFNCKVSHAAWTVENSSIVFSITADRFLRNMVRAIVGTLLDVGLGKTGLNEFKNILLSKDRSNAGASAPAHGLFLKKVIYPRSLFLGDKDGPHETNGDPGILE